MNKILVFAYLKLQKFTSGHKFFHDLDIDVFFSVHKHEILETYNAYAVF